MVNLHIWVSWFVQGDTQKKKKDSQWTLTWGIGGTLFFFVFFVLLCFFVFFWCKLQVRAHKHYNIYLNLRKNSACVRKTYFLLKTFSARFHPSRKSRITKFLQKYGSNILHVLNIDENSLQIQTAINILGQIHSSLRRKKIWRGLNALLYSKIHTSERSLEPSR